MTVIQGSGYSELPPARHVDSLARGRAAMKPANGIMLRSVPLHANSHAEADSRGPGACLIRQAAGRLFRGPRTVLEKKVGCRKTPESGRLCATSQSDPTASGAIVDGCKVIVFQFYEGWAHLEPTGKNAIWTIPAMLNPNCMSLISIIR